MSSLSGSEVDPAPAALPARSNGCGGDENEKAPINVEALNRFASLPTLPAKDPRSVDALLQGHACLGLS